MLMIWGFSVQVLVKKSFKTACRRAKIKNFRFHDLRHTFASHFVMGGGNLLTMQSLLGHKSLTMTLRYAHLAPAYKVKVMEVFNEKTFSHKTAKKYIDKYSTESISEEKKVEDFKPMIGDGVMPEEIESNFGDLEENNNF